MYLLALEEASGCGIAGLPSSAGLDGTGQWRRQGDRPGRASKALLPPVLCLHLQLSQVSAEGSCALPCRRPHARPFEGKRVSSKSQQQPSPRNSPGYKQAPVIENRQGNDQKPAVVPVACRIHHKQLTCPPTMRSRHPSCQGATRDSKRLQSRPQSTGGRREMRKAAGFTEKHRPSVHCRLPCSLRLAAPGLQGLLGLRPSVSPPTCLQMSWAEAPHLSPPPRFPFKMTPSALHRMGHCFPQVLSYQCEAKERAAAESQGRCANKGAVFSSPWVQRQGPN